MRPKGTKGITRRISVISNLLTCGYNNVQGCRKIKEFLSASCQISPESRPEAPGQEGFVSQSYHAFLDRNHPDDYRREEVTALVRAIHARENRLIIGLPGVGASNLLRFLVVRRSLVKTLARNVAGKPIIVTFAYAPCETLGDPHDLPALFDDIAGQLQAQGLADAPDGSHGYERLRRLLGGMEGDQWARVVIVIDNADVMLADADETFYANLKGLTNINKRVCFFMGVEALMSERVDPQGLLFAGRRLHVGCLNERDFTAAVGEEAERLGTTFDAEQRARLMALLGGHPGMLRAVSTAVVDASLSLLDPEETLLAALLRRDDVTRRCLRLWNGLGPAEQAALKRAAEGRKPDIRLSTDWPALRQFGLIEGEPPRLRSSLLRAFIKALEPALEPVWIEYPVYDEHGIIVSGVVKRGGRPVKVSPNELKLIACLAREPRLFTKDEVWQYVYYEYYRNGEAVSDAAVDNLVTDVRHRLGHKDYIKAYYRQGLAFQHYRPPAASTLLVHPDARTVARPK